MESLIRYWDSNCFLGFLKQEVDKFEKCNSVLELADKGQITIVTSAITLAEVIRMNGSPPMSPNDEITIRDFFKNDYISVRNCDRFIAEKARDLMWRYIHLKHLVRYICIDRVKINVLHWISVKQKWMLWQY